MKYIDTNIIIYALEEDPKYSEKCRKILKEIEEKDLEGGASMLSMVEIIHVLQKHKHALDTGKNADIGGVIAAIEAIGLEWFDLSFAAIERAAKYDYNLGGADRVHLATMDINSITEIISADKDFDGIPGIKRIDPLDYSGKN